MTGQEFDKIKLALDEYVNCAIMAKEFSGSPGSFTLHQQAQTRERMARILVESMILNFSG